MDSRNPWSLPGILTWLTRFISLNIVIISTGFFTKILETKPEDFKYKVCRTQGHLSQQTCTLIINSLLLRLQLEKKLLVSSLI